MRSFLNRFAVWARFWCTSRWSHWCFLALAHFRCWCGLGIWNRFSCRLSGWFFIFVWFFLHGSIFFACSWFCSNLLFILYLLLIILIGLLGHWSFFVVHFNLTSDGLFILHWSLHFACGTWCLLLVGFLWNACLQFWGFGLVSIFCFLSGLGCCFAVLCLFALLGSSFFFFLQFGKSFSGLA